MGSNVIFSYSLLLCSSGIFHHPLTHHVGCTYQVDRSIVLRLRVDSQLKVKAWKTRHMGWITPAQIPIVFFIQPKIGDCSALCYRCVPLIMYRRWYMMHNDSYDMIKWYMTLWFIPTLVNKDKIVPILYRSSQLCTSRTLYSGKIRLVYNCCQTSDIKRTKFQNWNASFFRLAFVFAQSIEAWC